MQNVDGQLIWIKKKIEKNRNLVIYTVDFHILCVYHSKLHCSKKKTNNASRTWQCALCAASCASSLCLTERRDDSFQTSRLRCLMLGIQHPNSINSALKFRNAFSLNTKNGIEVRERWKFVTIFFILDAHRKAREHKGLSLSLFSWWSPKNDKPTTN